MSLKPWGGRKKWVEDVCAYNEVFDSRLAIVLASEEVRQRDEQMGMVF